MARVFDIEEHKVKTGESIASLASDAGISWQDLAYFNWGTDVPTEINKHLRDDVGCTKKTASGKNYMFDDTDDPGIVYIPQKWEASGLSTEKEHVFRLRPIVPGAIDIVIPLEVDLDGDPTKDDQIRLSSDDGRYVEVVTSSDPAVEADESGRLLKYLFQDVPPGMYKVSVKIGDEWVDVLDGLKVTRNGVKYGTASFEATTDGSVLGAPEDEPDDEEESEFEELEDDTCAC